MKQYCRNALVVLVLSGAVLSAQTRSEIKPDPKNEKAEPAGGTDTGMSLFHAKAKSQKLKAENFKDIQRLRIITGNFGEGEDKSGFDKISADYKEAVKTAYKLDYHKAADKYLANRSDITALYQKISERYRKRTSDLLSQSADKMTDLELSEETAQPQDAAEINQILAKCRDRLAVGYAQFNMAEKSEKARRYTDAINHYRTAKVYAANMLVEMARTEAEKKKLKADFQNDYDDAENKLVVKK